MGDRTGAVPGRHFGSGRWTDLDAHVRGLRRGEQVNLRWILTHLVEEYARHLGHMDLLREAVDGSTGYWPRGYGLPRPDRALSITAAAVETAARRASSSDRSCCSAPPPGRRTLLAIDHELRAEVHAPGACSCVVTVIASPW